MTHTEELVAALAEGLEDSGLVKRLDYYARSTKAVPGPKEDPNTIATSWAKAQVAALTPATRDKMLLGFAVEALPSEAMLYWTDHDGEGPVVWHVRLPSIQRDRKVFHGPTPLAAISQAIVEVGRE